MYQDHISRLPKIILHDILSRLPEEDVARTSILSRVWAETWSTFPILSFRDTRIVRTFPQSMEDYQRNKKNFFDHVWKTVLRFRDQGLAIKEFKLHVVCFFPQDVLQDVDLWMKLATKSGVEVLQLCLREKDKEGRDQCYILPKGVLEAKPLKKLELKGGIRVDQSFLNNSIKFFSLRVLSLWHVILGGEQAIDYLFSSCPLLEYISLKYCFVLNPGGTRAVLSRIRMQGLPKLKEADLEGIQEVYIDVPNLENLHYNYGEFDPCKPCKMDFDRCKNLRGLYLRSLSGTVITNKWFLELSLKFPFLESLKFVHCTMSERINISSGQLKVLELSNCCNLEEANIDAPNLVSCVYHGDGDSKPIISFQRSSSQLEVNVEIYYLELCNLREFIQNFKPQNVLTSLSVFICQQDGQNLDILQVSSPPPSIEHLYLNVVSNEEQTSYLPLVYSLLSSCRPSTISMNLHFCSRAFIELFYETLMSTKKVDFICNSGPTKYWWDDLKDIKVTSSIKTPKDADLKTILDALLTDVFPKNITFKLEF